MRKDRIIIGVGVVVEHEGKFLCVVEKESNEKIDKEAGMTGLPSGHVLYDEDIFEAGAREVLEETGCKVEIVDIIGFYLVKGALGIGLRGKVVNKPQNFTYPNDIERVEWITKDDFFERHTRPGNVQVLKDYIAGKSLPKNVISDVR